MYDCVMGKVTCTAQEIYSASLSGKLMAMPEPIRYQMGQTLLRGLKVTRLKRLQYETLCWAMHSIIKSQKPSAWLKAQHRNAARGAFGWLGEDRIRAVLMDKQMPNGRLRPYLKEFARALTDAYGVKPVHFYFQALSKTEFVRGSFCACGKGSRRYGRVNIDAGLDPVFFSEKGRAYTFLPVISHECAHNFQLECVLQPKVLGVPDIDYRWLKMEEDAIAIKRFGSYYENHTSCIVFSERDAEWAETYTRSHLSKMIRTKGGMNPLVIG